MNESKTVQGNREPHDADADAGAELGLEGADLRRVIDSASELARESPHVALGLALAAGFVLGGGLTPRLLGSVAMIAGRTYLGRAVRETLATVVEEQLSAARG
jgi:hypothetical protein